MSEAFLGEIRLFSFDFPPRGWALCNGQFLSIAQNQALFALLGTMYGGNGQTTFALPDLQGRVPIHIGGGFVQGQRAGEESHILGLSELPQHTHGALGDAGAANATTPVGKSWASQEVSPYSGAANTSMRPTTTSTVGGGQPHLNMSPYLTLNLCICLGGIFPSQN